MVLLPRLAFVEYLHSGPQTLANSTFLTTVYPLTVLACRHVLQFAQAPFFDCQQVLPEKPASLYEELRAFWHRNSKGNADQLKALEAGHCHSGAEK